MRRLLRDDGDGLDGGRSRADDAEPLSREIHALVRPAPGVIPLAAEGLDTLEGRDLEIGETAGGHDAVARGHDVALVGAHRPAARRLVEVRRDNLRLEFNVALEVEAVGHVVGVFQDLGLRGVALRPLPLLLELGRERVRVVHALDVAARAGIAVPVPGAADALAALEDLRGKAELPEAIEHVEPGEAGSDDHHVHLARLHSRISHWISFSSAVGPRGDTPAPPAPPPASSSVVEHRRDKGPVEGTAVLSTPASPGRFSRSAPRYRIEGNRTQRRAIFCRKQWGLHELSRD